MPLCSQLNRNIQVVQSLRVGQIAAKHNYRFHAVRQFLPAVHHPYPIQKLTQNLFGGSTSHRLACLCHSLRISPDGRLVGDHLLVVLKFAPADHFES